MNKGVIFGFFLVLALSIPATAEYYRYKDAHGNTIYTDDYSKVPPDQRDEVESYNEYKSRPPAESPVDSEEAASESTEDEIEKERQRLEQRQNTLTEEYDGLAAERDALNKAQKAAVTKVQISDHNKRVVEFNARIKAYEEKRDAHTIDVDNFKKRTADQEPDEAAQ